MQEGLIALAKPMPLGKVAESSRLRSITAAASGGEQHLSDDAAQLQLAAGTEAHDGSGKRGQALTTRQRRRLFEQPRLADACLAANDDDAAALLTGGLGKPLQQCASFRLSVRRSAGRSLLSCSAVAALPGIQKAVPQSRRPGEGPVPQLHAYVRQQLPVRPTAIFRHAWRDRTGVQRD